MKKILSLIKYTLLIICVITLVLVGVMAENYEGVSIMLTWMYILLGIAILVAVIGPLFNLLQNPQAAVRSLLGIGIVIVVLVIAYAMSSAEPVVNPAGGYFDKPGELLLTDTGLYTTYFALVAAVVIAVVGEIRSSIK